MAQDQLAILKIKHLPSCLTDDECIDLLKHFGSMDVKLHNNNSDKKEKRKKRTAFATFNDKHLATLALKQLHQLEVLGSTLSAEFANNKNLYDKLFGAKIINYSSSTSSSTANSFKNNLVLKENIPYIPIPEDAEKKIKNLVTEEINSISTTNKIDYPINTDLFYRYPPINSVILKNISFALISVPSFYVQVLHLMNKMNLPAPFRASPLLESFSLLQILNFDSSLDSEIVSNRRWVDGFIDANEESESEIESDSGEKSKALASTIKKRLRKQMKINQKRLKLTELLETYKKSEKDIPTKIENHRGEEILNIFDQIQQVSSSNKKIKINVDKDILSNIDNVSQIIPTKNNNNNDIIMSVPDDNLNHTQIATNEGFGKIIPELKEQKKMDTDDTEFEWTEQVFKSKEEMKSEQLSIDELKKNTSTFKNYSIGTKTTRLYIKNLAKSVQESDLHFIFGNYVNWKDNDEKIMYDIRLMKEGRMKGQAFITLPNEMKAEKAITETNGLVLFDKPMVVTFAHSAKPKPK